MRLLLTLLLVVLLIVPAFGQDRVDDVLHRGEELFDQGRYDEAIREYDRVIKYNLFKIDTDLAVAWCNKGAALYELGRSRSSRLHSSEALRQA